MLKLTYTDNNFDLEHLDDHLDNWLNLRVVLCLRASTSIYVEPSTASFSIPKDLPYWKEINTLKLENNQNIEINVSDAEYLEISLGGTWVTSDETSEEGVFISSLSTKTEILLTQLWQVAQKSTSAI